MIWVVDFHLLIQIFPDLLLDLSGFLFYFFAVNLNIIYLSVSNEKKGIPEFRIDYLFVVFLCRIHSELLSDSFYFLNDILQINLFFFLSFLIIIVTIRIFAEFSYLSFVMFEVGVLIFVLFGKRKIYELICDCLGIFYLFLEHNETFL